MAHKINVTNGEASFFTVKEKAWHGLGKVLEKCPTSEEAIKLAGLDYEVGKVPVYAQINGKFHEVDGKYSTYRKDTNDVFGVVGSRYEIIQNKDTFSFFDAAVGEGAAIYETAGALGKGETIFITAKLPGYMRVGNNDDIEKYLLLTAAHDGSGAVQAMFTTVRVVCANTLAAALKGATNKVYIKHTKSAKDNLEAAHKVLGISNILADELQTIFGQMSKTKIGDKQITRFAELVMLTPKQLNELAEKPNDREEILSTKQMNILNKIEEYYYTGAGQQYDTCKGTVFGALNAVTGYFQNVKNFTNEDAKIESNLLGNNAKTMQKAFDLGLTLVNGSVLN